jgi:hypothetical protein
VESTWSYHHRPLIAGALRERQQYIDADILARSWTAQLRLCRRFRQLERRKHITGVAVVAVAVAVAGNLPDSCEPRCRPEPMLLTLGRSPIGATAPASPRTRRSTADEGKILATLLPCRR